MKDVASGGRTVLFVSHNMAAVRALCSRAICLNQGTLTQQGPIDEVAAAYVHSSAQRPDVQALARENGDILIEELALIPSAAAPFGHVRKPDLIRFWIRFRLPQTIKGLRVGYSLENATGLIVNGSASGKPDSSQALEAGIHTAECAIPSEVLAPGEYSLSIGFDHPPYTEQILQIPNAFPLYLQGEPNPVEGGLVELGAQWALKSNCQ